MAEFICMNYDKQSLCKLNRVRLHQQVIFLSDVMDASGRTIETKYLDELPCNEQWSRLIFSKESPSDSDFRLWNAALPQIRALGGRLHVGRHLKQGHKVWPWKYDIESLQLFHIKENGQWKRYASRTTMMTGSRPWRGHRTRSDGEGSWKG